MFKITCKWCGKTHWSESTPLSTDPEDDCELEKLRELRDVIVHNAGTNEPVIDFTLAVRMARELKAKSG